MKGLQILRKRGNASRKPWLATAAAAVALGACAFAYQLAQGGDLPAGSRPAGPGMNDICSSPPPV